MYGDGEGLDLRVGPTGAKSWILRQVLTGALPQGKPRRWKGGLGSVSHVSLAEARELRKNAATTETLVLRITRTRCPSSGLPGASIRHCCQRGGTKDTRKHGLAGLKTRLSRGWPYADSGGYYGGYPRSACPHLDGKTRNGKQPPAKDRRGVRLGQGGGALRRRNPRQWAQESAACRSAQAAQHACFDLARDSCVHVGVVRHKCIGAGLDRRDRALDPLDAAGSNGIHALHGLLCLS